VIQSLTFFYMETNANFSEREKEILRLVLQAKGRKKIADELNLSIHTVDTHLRHIHLKSNTHSLPELVVWAMRGDKHLIFPTN
jgi:DNA-binding CsgD family transcriptional regulator